jgi:hypothetical protein
VRSPSALLPDILADLLEVPLVLIQGHVLAGGVAAGMSASKQVFDEGEECLAK